jgi:hypothetical protein
MAKFLQSTLDKNIGRHEKLEAGQEIPGLTTEEKGTIEGTREHKIMKTS